MDELKDRLVKKAPELDRLARFILDFADDTGSSGSYGGDSSKTAGLFNLNLDSQAIAEVRVKSWHGNPILSPIFTVNTKKLIHCNVWGFESLLTLSNPI